VVISKTSTLAASVMGISCLSNPTPEKIRVRAPAGTLIANFPVSSVWVAIFSFPFISTVMPGKGALSCRFLTTPVIGLPPWANNPLPQTNRKSREDRKSLIRQIDFVRMAKLVLVKIGNKSITN
jgi:hypothetical protein